MGLPHIIRVESSLLESNNIEIVIGFEVRGSLLKKHALACGWLAQNRPECTQIMDGLEGEKRTRNQTAQKSGPTDFGFLDLSGLCKQKC